MKINESTGLYENYGVWHTPFWKTDIFYLCMKICFIILLCGLCFLGIKLFSYYRQKKISVPEQLLRELNTLKKEQRLSEHHGKEFYMHASDIIKRYFFFCYQYDVLGTTDTELLDYLQKKHEDKDAIQEIKDIFNGSQVIKFAGKQAVQERIDADYNRIQSILQKEMQTRTASKQN